MHVLVCVCVCVCVCVHMCVCVCVSIHIILDKGLKPRMLTDNHPTPLPDTSSPHTTPTPSPPGCVEEWARVPQDLSRTKYTHTRKHTHTQTHTHTDTHIHTQRMRARIGSCTSRRTKKSQRCFKSMTLTARVYSINNSLARCDPVPIPTHAHLGAPPPPHTHMCVFVCVCLNPDSQTNFFLACPEP
jgi:hypothetical protein